MGMLLDLLNVFGNVLGTGHSKRNRKDLERTVEKIRGEQKKLHEEMVSERFGTYANCKSAKSWPNSSKRAEEKETKPEKIVKGFNRNEVLGYLRLVKSTKDQI